MHELLESQTIKRHGSEGEVSDDNWRLFKPEIGDDGAAYSKIRNLAKLPHDDAVLRLAEYAAGQDAKTMLGLRTRVAATLLRDLLLIGWEVKVTGHHLYVRPHVGADAILTTQVLSFRSAATTLCVTPENSIQLRIRTQPVDPKQKSPNLAARDFLHE